VHGVSVAARSIADARPGVRGETMDPPSASKSCRANQHIESDFCNKIGQMQTWPPSWRAGRAATG
jgi:hypothetical protein